MNKLNDILENKKKNFLLGASITVGAVIAVVAVKQHIELREVWTSYGNLSSYLQDNNILSRDQIINIMSDLPID